MGPNLDVMVDNIDDIYNRNRLITQSNISDGIDSISSSFKSSFIMV